MNWTEAVLLIEIMIALGLMTAEDILKKEINIWMLLVVFVACMGLGITNECSIRAMLLGTLPGVIMILVSFLCRGKLGMGDAILLSALGISMELWNVVTLLLLSLTLAAVFGGVLIVLKKADRKTELPFVPFIATSFIICQVIRICS